MANPITYINVLKRLSELKFRVNQKSGQDCHPLKSVGETRPDFSCAILTRKKWLLIVRTGFE